MTRQNVYLIEVKAIELNIHFIYLNFKIKYQIYSAYNNPKEKKKV